MSEKIEVGDLVESIPNMAGVKPGIIGMVLRIESPRLGNIDGRYFVVEGIHPFILNNMKMTATHESCFRKIDPDSEKKATKVFNWNKEPVSV